MEHLFHVANTVIEGTFGSMHTFFAAQTMYKTTGGSFKVSKEQILLGRFTGLLMIAVAIISYAARKDTESIAGKAVMKGLAFYHSCASLVNAIQGCGINGDHKNALRDYFHAVMHFCLAMGFLRKLLKPSDPQIEQ